MNLKNLIPFGKKSVPAGREEEEHPLIGLQREMNKLFDTFWSGWEPEPFRDSSRSFSPRIEVTESDRSITVTAELPGMSGNNIDVSLTRDALTIRGEKKDEKENSGADYYYSERSFGSFTRTIPLAREVDVDKADASFNKGVLTIVLPKSAQSIGNIRNIPVKAG